MRAVSSTFLSVLLASFLVVSGCDSFIDREPDTFLSSSKFYSSPEEVEQGVLGVYSQLQPLYDVGGSDFFAFTEMRSDNTTFQYNPGDRGDEQMESLDDFRIEAEDVPVEELWTDLYQGVLQANTVLTRIEGVEFEDDTQRSKLRAEAQFLRALYYYHLVNLWGGVPLILEEVDGPDAAFTEEGRSSTEAVYQQVISGAESAINNLPTRAEAEQGRATKSAARMLLAKTHMWRGNYQEALGPLREVRDSGYGLLDDYENIYDPGNKGHREEIFSVQYDGSISNGEESSSFLYRFVPFNSVNSGDLTFGNIGGVAFAGYNIPTRDLLENYEQGDERLEASVGFYEREENTQYPVAIGDSIPYIEKYRHEHSVEFETPDNFPVFRYAEALLLLAEAINETEGPTNEALSALNDVRERAGLSRLSNLSQSEFREAVYQEQQVELAFENKRWYDLLRNDRMVDVMRPHGQRQRDLVPRLTPSSYQVEGKQLLPIPFREVRLNDLEQNPGW